MGVQVCPFSLPAGPASCTTGAGFRGNCPNEWFNIRE